MGVLHGPEQQNKKHRSISKNWLPGALLSLNKHTGMSSTLLNPPECLLSKFWGLICMFNFTVCITSRGLPNSWYFNTLFKLYTYPPRSLLSQVIQT